MFETHKSVLQIDAGVLAVLPRLRHLVIHEPRPDHTIPKYPTDPYANIGDDIFAVAIRQIENGTPMRMRLNFCGQITVAGIIAMIEVREEGGEIGRIGINFPQNFCFITLQK